jgi:hypothetical protein
MDIELHSRQKKIDLAHSLTGRRKFYLDMCFWISLRDADLGVNVEPTVHEMLHHIRRAVMDGRIVCPISEAVLSELMKQPFTRERRCATASLIDELSLGVSLASQKVILGTEIYSFLLRAQGGAECYAVQELIWTKVAYAFGDIYPVVREPPTEQERAHQKSVYDYGWDMTCRDWMTAAGDQHALPNGFGELCKSTNDLNAQHENELSSFANTYDIELRGIIELVGNLVAEIICHQFDERATKRPARLSEEWALLVNYGRNLLYHAIKQKQGRDALRTIHIYASIHAAMRWDKKRKFKVNDYHDFSHALAALSYFDAFFTEGPLHTLVTANHVKLDRVNNCKVISNVKAAVELLRNL